MKNAPALARGLSILNLVSKRQRISLAEMAKVFPIPRASLIRLLACLEENGYLKKDGLSGEFVLGNQALQTVMTAYEKNPLVKYSKMPLKALASRWGITFVVYQHVFPYRCIWFAKEEPLEGIKTKAIGFVLDRLNVSAQGKLFLSKLTGEQIKAFVKNGLAFKATPYTVTDEKGLLRQIEQIRKQGYAYQERENSVSMKQYAVDWPLPDSPNGFALACFMPLDYMKGQHVLDDMLLAAGKLEGAI